MSKKHFIALCVCLFVACTGETEEIDNSVQINNTMDLEFLYTLNSNDLLAIGQILSVQSGGIEDPIYLLDEISKEVYLVHPDSLLRSYIPHGEGPQEVLDPNALSIQDGLVYVCDSGKKRIVSYQADSLMETYNYDYDIVNNMFATADGFMLDIFQVEYNDDGASVLQSIQYVTKEFDTVIEYFSRGWDFPCIDYYEEYWLCEIFSDGDYACIVEDITNYSFTVHSIAEKDTLGTFARDVARNCLTEDEIRSEEEAMLEFLKNSPGEAVSGQYEPWPYARLIRIAGIDSLDRIWIQVFSRGAESIELDVWDLQSRNLITTIHIPWNMHQLESYAYVNEDKLIVYTNANAYDLEIAVYEVGME